MGVVKAPLCNLMSCERILDSGSLCREHIRSHGLRRLHDFISVESSVLTKKVVS